jgi:hypothetical protein
MGRLLAVSPFLTGDPIRLGPDISTFIELVAALDIPFLKSPGCLQLAPGVALIHSLTGADARVAVHWLHLPHEPRLIPGGAPVGTSACCRERSP